MRFPALAPVVLAFTLGLGRLPALAAEETVAIRPPAIELPAINEEVPLPRIKEICAFYGLHALWQKIERDPPPRPFKSDGCTGWVNEWHGISIYPAGFLHDLWRKIEQDPPVRPFKSDGCTGWFDDWKGISLYPAGFLHDLKYWAGYPGEDVERLVADAELMTDVARLLKSTGMAETMFHGVRLGGSEHLNASFSWGFGRQKPGDEATEPVPTEKSAP